MSYRFSSGRKLHRDHAAAFFAQQLDGIGELNFAALVRLHAADHVENHRREDVAAGDRQVARRLLRARLLHQVHDPEDVAGAVLRLHDAVMPGLLARHFLHRDHATGAPESNTSAIRLTARETAFSPRMESPSATRNGSSPAKFSRAQYGVAQPLLQALAGVEEVGLERFEIQLLQQVLLVRLRSARWNSSGIVVEVILDGSLAAAGDEQDLLDAVRDQFLHHVLHDRLARDRQHLLGLRLGGRQKPRAMPGDGNDCALESPSEYSNLTPAARGAV